MVELEKEKVTQNILLENREHMGVSGVDEVDSFNEKQITAFTTLGFITIKGSSLHIKKFNTNTRELNITGRIDEIKYSNGEKRETNHSLNNFFNKLFK